MKDKKKKKKPVSPSFADGLGRIRCPCNSNNARGTHKYTHIYIFTIPTKRPI